MEALLKSVRGVMRGGVAVPEIGTTIPDGTPVEITVRSNIVPPEFQEEFEYWQQLGMHSWSLIDEWEKEEQL